MRRTVLGVALAATIAGGAADVWAQAQAPTPAAVPPYVGVWRFAQRVARAPFAGLTETETTAMIGRQVEIGRLHASTWTRTGSGTFAAETCPAPQYQSGPATRQRVAADYRLPAADLSALPTNFTEIAVTCRGNLMLTMRQVSATVMIADVEGVFFRLDRTAATPSPPATAGGSQPGLPQTQGQQAAARPSFSCARVQRPDETLICGEAGLARADAALDEVFQRVLRRLPIQQQGQFRREQRLWIVQRNQRCDISADTKITAENRARLTTCLTEAYAARQRELEERASKS